jgi:hypothetical protein
MADLMIPANWFVAGTTVDGMYRNLVAQLGTQWKLRVERPTPDTLVIRHQTAPGWWWVKSAQTATIQGIDVEGGARFTATGRTSQAALVVIRRAFGVPDDAGTRPAE